MSVTVHVFIGLTWRILAYQVSPFDQHIGRGESDALSSQWIHCKKTDVGTLNGDGLNRLASGIEHHQLDWHAQALGERTGEVHGNTAYFTGVPYNADEFKVPYVRSRLTSSTTGAGGTVFSLGYVHNLSKRTTVYAHWARVSNRGGATYSNGVVAPSANGSTGGYEFGIRHFF